MKKHATKKGKFIVIDGTDGSGKATQTKLLEIILKKNGYRVKTIEFPQYKKNFFGKLIKEHLQGLHGNFLSVNPYLASTLYAADRYESKQKIEKWLAEGYTVIADRYVSANQLHQGGKIKDIGVKVWVNTWVKLPVCKPHIIPFCFYKQAVIEFPV